MLPLVMFMAIFGDRVLDQFIKNDNDNIDAQTEMLETLVGGSGWTDSGGWGLSE